MFEEQLDFFMNPPEGTISVTGEGLAIPENRLSQEEADKVMDLLNGITRMRSFDVTIWMIVSESAGDYFNGRTTIENAVRVIQNRVSIYLAEQAG